MLITKEIFKLIFDRSSVTERQESEAKMREMRSLVFYVSMKKTWGKEEYINRCSKNEIMGFAWWRLGVWKLRGIRKNFDRGICPLCYGRENAQHIILECRATVHWRVKYMDKKLLELNPDLAYKKILNNDFRKLNFVNIGKMLFRIKTEWEKIISDK